MAKKPSTVLSQLQTNPGLLAGGVAAGLAVVAVAKRRRRGDEALRPCAVAPTQ